MELESKDLQSPVLFVEGVLLRLPSHSAVAPTGALLVGLRTVTNPGMQTVRAWYRCLKSRDETPPWGLLPRHLVSS